MPDTLNIDLRHTIRLCWKSLRRQQALKKVVINQDLAEMLPDEFSPTQQILNRQSCGDSSNRLCELLVGKALQDYTTSQDAVDIADEGVTGTAIQAMKRTVGRVLVRLNIVGGGAGHSYVFMSKFRQASESLEGLIYQTNVGCHMDSAFDLIEWIDDPKSHRTIDLETHIAELRRNLSGLASPDGQYQRSFMLSSKALTTGEVNDLKRPARRAQVIFLWEPIDAAVAERNLRTLRETPESGIDQPPLPPRPRVARVRQWPVVPTNFGPNFKAYR